jgi:hypothetical protein
MGARVWDLLIKVEGQHVAAGLLSSFSDGTVEVVAGVVFDQEDYS